MSLALWKWGVDAYDAIVARLRGMGEIVPPLALRVVMGGEFWQSGLEKYNGENWFADIQSDFPFPMNLVPANISWFLATWFELIGAIALWLGVGTRFFAFSLLVLTFVATAAVHWPDMWSMWSDLLAGYSVSDHGHGNFKLPLLFSVMLLPLIFSGPGKASVDALLRAYVIKGDQPAPTIDGYSIALAFIVLGFPMLLLIPTLGITFLSLAVLAAGAQRFLRS